MLSGKRLAVIGAGKIGEVLIKGILDAQILTPEQISVTTAHGTRSRLLAERFGVTALVDNSTAAKSADFIILGVKPQAVAGVVAEIDPALTLDKLLISVAASVSTNYIEKRLSKPVPVVRAMPNTPCCLKKGMTGIAGGRHATADQLEQTRAIFGGVGRVLTVEEKHMDAVTGLSASGPAFIYIIIESLAEAGVKTGLPRDIATELAAQTVLGAGAMVIETGEHPAKLKDAVTTPAGCTMDGILELEEGGLRVTLIKAVVKAVQRAKELLAD